MKNLIEKLKQEARTLSTACTCDKKGCGDCRRKKLLWEAANEIKELRKHLKISKD